MQRKHWMWLRGSITEYLMPTKVINGKEIPYKAIEPAPTYNIDQYVKRTIRRGYSGLSIVNVARDLNQKMKSTRLPKNADNIGTIREFLEWYNGTTSGVQYEYPEHYRPYIQVLEKTNERFRIGFSSAPQVGKTTITLLGMLWRAFTLPNSRQVYATYSLDRAKSVLQEDLVPMLQSVGIHFDLRGGLIKIRSVGKTEGYDSQIKFTSYSSGLTGYSAQFIVIDDIINTWEEAFSSAISNTVYQWYKSSVLTRDSGNLGIVIMMTRWSKNDLIGKLLEQNQIEYIRIPAICDEDNDPIGRNIGESIVFGEKDLNFFNKKKEEIGDLEFSSMYQGLPSPELSKFKPGIVVDISKLEHSIYDTNHWYTSYGLDLAYGGKDESCLVQMKTSKSTGLSIVSEVISAKGITHTEFVENHVSPLIKRDPGKCLWYCSSLEGKTTVGELKKLCQWIYPSVTQKSKMIRAVHTIRAWNEGYLQVSKDIQNVNRFMSLIENFEGIKSNEKDDQVDAMVAAFDLVKDIRTRILKNKESGLTTVAKKKTPKPYDPFKRVAGRGMDRFVAG